MKFDFYKWLIKYKLLHIIGWMVVSFLLMFMIYDSRSPIFPQWIGNLMVTGLAFPVCYYAAYQLVPNFLYQKKIWPFIGLVFIAAFFNAIITYVISLFIYHLLTGHAVFPSVFYVLTLGLTIVVIDIILISISCIIKIISDRFFMEQQLIEVEKEKLSTELNFLRAQINPHFLFNVMNTIYFQIDKKNTQARASVETLSEMLRYQLYECTTDKIPIEKEVVYIKNYVAIQTLRMEAGTDIQLSIDDRLSGFFIAPLLLLPIIENAFKHVSNSKNPEENKIHISLQCKSAADFFIHISNTFDKTMRATHLLQSGGLGMQNLQRRLALLYPESHEFIIGQHDNIFETSLKITHDA